MQQYTVSYMLTALCVYLLSLASPYFLSISVADLIRQDPIH